MSERPLGLGGVWGAMIREWLEALVPPGATAAPAAASRPRHARGGGGGGGGGEADRGFAQRIGRGPRDALRVVALSAFASRAELIDVAMASAHVPFFLDGRASREGRAHRGRGDRQIARLLLGGDAARAELDTAIRAGAVLAPPPGREAAPVWLEHGADTAFAATVRQSDFLRLVSPEGLYAMVDAGRAAVRRRHEARDAELAVLGVP